MFELAVGLGLAAAVGWLRPRWSTLWAALVPAALACAWFLLHEDVPGYETTAMDLVWFVGMSIPVGLAFAAACAAGVVARRRFRRSTGVGGVRGR